MRTVASVLALLVVCEAAVGCGAKEQPPACAPSACGVEAAMLGHPVIAWRKDEATGKSVARVDILDKEGLVVLSREVDFVVRYGTGNDDAPDGVAFTGRTLLIFQNRRDAP